MAKRILLADDDPALRALIRATLGTMYELFEAENGDEAIAMAREIHPDLVLLDADMPLVDGFTASRTLRSESNTRDVPIFMLTGKTAADHARLGEAAGLTGYLRKPFSPSQMLSLVDRILQADGATLLPFTAYPEAPSASDEFASKDVSIEFAQTLSYARELGELYESARQHAIRSLRLVEIGRDLVSIRELEAVVQYGLERALAFSEYQGGSVMLLEGPDGPLVVRAASGPSQVALGTTIDELSQSLAGRALHTRAPVVIRGHGEDLGVDWRPYTKSIASSVCLPLLTRGGTAIGVLALSSISEERAIDKTELDALQLLAALFAASIESAQLHEQLHDLVGRLFIAEEEERRRVAYDIHDGLAQVAAGAHQHLQAYASQHRPRSPEAQHALGRALDLAQRTVRETRRVIANLRPTALDDFGLATAIRLDVEALTRSGWEVGYRATLGDERLEPATETALYRVTQEALTNVTKHAGATRVEVRLEAKAGLLHLEIEDWGHGFDATQLAKPGVRGSHVGLAGMRERISQLGGQITIVSHEDRGTLITAIVPLRLSRNDPQGSGSGPAETIGRLMVQPLAAAE